MISNNKGFSIVEVLIAILILSVGILAASGMQIGAIQGNAGSSELNGAMSLASDQLETLIATPWTAAGVPADIGTLGVAGLNANTAATADASPAQPGTPYTMYINVASLNPPTNTLQQVNVIVTWTGILGFPRQVNFTGIRSATVSK